MWFETLTGFREESIEQVHNNISIDGTTLISHVNGKKFICGVLEIPSLMELRRRVAAQRLRDGRISVREVIADVQQLHTDKSNAGALFQVASQFNLLEMPSSDVTPENGVSHYEYDLTQGPACAIAAGAGIVYRNYFVNVNGEIGQSADNQIDCLADIGQALGNTNHRLWVMKNGYALASEQGLFEINSKIAVLSESERDDLKRLLRIGIQWDTEVTLNNCKHTVTQAYCSALPIGYSQHSSELWAEFAQLILEASYEATICAGILNSIKSGNNSIYLTLVGGGVFGNDNNWIINAIAQALHAYKHIDLDVAIVSYGASKDCVQELLHQFQY